uniref:Golgi apparatus membrane protein TVP23 n=1 Tax=Mesocestoides corti TaxID=53468 RepID=A0A5K3FDW4_MESCO
MHFFVEPNATENVAHRQAAKSTFVFFDASTHGFNKSIDASLFNLFGRLRMFASSFGGFDYRDVVAYFHKNIGTIINVIDPVWRVVSYHAGFITTSLMGTASLLCAGGSVVLNFTFSFLIFLSTLFYLLAASDSTYLPVEFIASLTPQSGDASPAVLSFYTSAEAAVTSVVVTTLKRTVFYGMYTLLIHTLFGLDAVVIPSIIATILGAIPLVGTYWAVLPGVVELLCLRGSYWLAFLLLILHILPYSFMDTALYSEIKGAGHPYLTGLSIAGGLYYFGIEGAFVGPMVLCFVLVGVNLYRCLMLESTDRAQVTRETALRTRVASIDRYRSVNKPRLKLYAHRRNIYRISPKKQTSPMHVQILRARSEGADFGK